MMITRDNKYSLSELTPHTFSKETFDMDPEKRNNAEYSSSCRILLHWLID